MPCTIRYVAGEGYIDACPYQDIRKTFDEEFSESVQQATAKLKEAVHAAEELLNKKNLTKADRSNLLEHLRKSENLLQDSLPFIKAQFTEQMDRTVAEAKAEVEAFTVRRAQEILKAREENPEGCSRGLGEESIQPGS
jgi:hypothetical protein